MKRGCIHARHLGFAYDVRLRHRWLAVNEIKRDVRNRFDRFRGMSGLFETARQRHRIAARMRRRDQLFRISADAVGETIIE